MSEDVKKRLQQLSPGDHIAYGDLIQKLEKSDLEFKAENIYSDSVGFLERWFIEEQEIAVIEGTAVSDIIVRTAQPEVIR